MKKRVVGAVSLLIGAVGGAVGIGKVIGTKAEEKQRLADKHLALFLMMNQWVKVKQEGKNLKTYFERNHYHRIAIYGMSYAGETLAEELKDSGVEVAYGIDQKADIIYADVDVVTIEQNLEPVDAIVVTAITFFNEIEERLSAKLDCPIISLEDILYEV